ncbi:DUF397 domain-containing protein [Amycolatopsis sp. NPDC059027]|uniref:DUF397 domain-containing protein n=1 Tax=unclassified Amycolatopsis TaxID=2618356 RepID=UPI00366D8A17
MIENTVWRKSSYSGPQNACVELAISQAGARMRDTKDREGGTLEMSAPAFAAFLRVLGRS